MSNLLSRRALAGAGLAFVLMALPAVALAQSTFDTSASGAPFGTAPSSGATFNTGSGPVQCGGGPCGVTNPLGSTTSLCGLLLKLFQGVVAIGIPVAVLFIIWSGFQFVLAQGNPKQLGKARKNFLYTVIGIAIFLGAWLLATVIAATVNAIGGSNIISCQ